VWTLGPAVPAGWPMADSICQLLCVMTDVGLSGQVGRLKANEVVPRRRARAVLGCPESAIMPRPDSSVVERGPEKAGVGGSIPSLATI
jgi:hypothetical protein